MFVIEPAYMFVGQKSFDAMLLMLRSQMTEIYSLPTGMRIFRNNLKRCLDTQRALKSSA